jgi:hypothetical protein
VDGAKSQQQWPSSTRSHETSLLTRISTTSTIVLVLHGVQAQRPPHRSTSTEVGSEKSSRPQQSTPASRVRQPPPTWQSTPASITAQPLPASPSERKTRASHQKSHRGCHKCKARHIRCDRPRAGCVSCRTGGCVRVYTPWQSKARRKRGKKARKTPEPQSEDWTSDAETPSRSIWDDDDEEDDGDAGAEQLGVWEAGPGRVEPSRD